MGYISRPSLQRRSQPWLRTSWTALGSSKSKSSQRSSWRIYTLRTGGCCCTRASWRRPSRGVALRTCPDSLKGLARWPSCLWCARSWTLSPWTRAPSTAWAARPSLTRTRTRRTRRWWRGRRNCSPSPGSFKCTARPASSLFRLRLSRRTTWRSKQTSVPATGICTGGWSRISSCSGSCKLCQSATDAR